LFTKIVQRHTNATLPLEPPSAYWNSQKVAETRRCKDNADLRKGHWQEQARGGG